MSDLPKFINLVTNQFKIFLTPPVFVFTHEDYAGRIINQLDDIRLTQAHTSTKYDNTSVTIAHFNHQWFQGTVELERFKDQIEDMISEKTLQLKTARYIETVKDRMVSFNNFMGTLISGLNLTDAAVLHTELELIQDMNQTLVNKLREKEKILLASYDNEELAADVEKEVEASLDWLDRIHDAGMMKFCDMIGVNVPQLNATRHTIAEYISGISENPDREVLAHEVDATMMKLKRMMRSGDDHELEIGKVLDKICSLEQRIDQLALAGDSPALLALQHKKQYLADRLETLAALQSTLKAASERPTGPSKRVEIERIMHHGNVTMFDHRLSEFDRLELVRTLDNEWDEVVRGATGSVARKSIISILSAADPAEDHFADDLGQFTVDQHGRRIYGKEDDPAKYQVNEFGNLVPLADTDSCVFFYDDCGRYFIDDQQRRVYKARSSASEYVVGEGRLLVKSREMRDGVEYRYDSLGRYFVDEKTKRKIYKEADGTSEYEDDGLGNLIRLGTALQDTLPCDEVKLCTEESTQLRGAVGHALRVSLAEVVLLQPDKPIKYLGHRLLHYIKDQERQIKKRKEEEELMAEREIRIAEEKEHARRRQEALEEQLRLLAAQSLGDSEMTYQTDSNLFNYKTEY